MSPPLVKMISSSVPFSFHSAAAFLAPLAIVTRNGLVPQNCEYPSVNFSLACAANTAPVTTAAAATPNSLRRIIVILPERRRGRSSRPVGWSRPSLGAIHR